jgi:hypothetical protein
MREMESQRKGFFDNAKLPFVKWFGFLLLPNPAPADTSNSNSPRGLG